MKQKIRDLLIDCGDGPDRASILAALRLLASGIQTGELRQEDAAQCVATAMGYLVAGRRLEAGWWGMSPATTPSRRRRHLQQASPRVWLRAICCLQYRRKRARTGYQ